MSRKSGGNSFQWSSIVLSWVNLFEPETHQILKIRDVRNSDFLTRTITTIYKFSGVEEVTYKNNDEIALKFIKEYFPEIMKEKRFSMKNEDDVLVLISLLMYTVCIKCKIDDFVSKTCSIKLDDKHQEVIKKFFELMLTIDDGKCSRRNVMDIVQQCFEPLTVMETRKSLSPQKNCLREFLGSPVLQEKYKMIKEENDVRHLNVLLQEENSELAAEKDALTKLNQELESSIKKLQTQLNEKTKEISSLKEECMQWANKGSGENTLNQTEKMLKKEIEQLKIDLNFLHTENESLIQDNEKYLKQHKDLEVEFNTRENDLVEKQKNIVELEERLLIYQENSTILEDQVKELKQVIEQYEEERRPKEELDMSAPRVEENIGQVLLDLELKEKMEVINKLEHQLKTQERTCEEKAEKIRQHEIAEKKLQDELQAACLEIKNLTSTLSDFKDQIEISKYGINDLASQVEELKTINDVTANSLTVSLAENRDLKEKLSDSLKDVAQLNRAISTKDCEIKQMTTLIQNLSQEKINLEMENAGQAKQIRELETSKKNLQDELQLKCSEVETKNHALNDLKNQIKVSETEIRTLTEEVAELEKKNKITANSLTETLTEINDLQRQLSDSFKDVAQLNSAVAEKESEIDRIKTLIEAVSAEKKELEIQNSHQAEQVAKLEIIEKNLKDELQSLCLEVENKTGALGDLENQLNVREAQIKTLTDQVEGLKTKNETIENNLRESLAENEEIKVQLSNSLNSVAQLNTLVADKECKIREMIKLVETLTEEKGGFLVEITQQAEHIKSLNICENKLKEELQAKCEEVDRVTSALNDLSKEFKESEVEIQTLKNQIEDLRECIKIVESNLSASLAENKDVKDQLSDSLKNIEFLNTKIMDNESHLDQMKILVESLSEEKKEFQSRCTQQAEHIKQLNICENKLKEELQAKCEEVDRVTSALNDLSNQFKESEVEIQTLKNQIKELRECNKIIETNLSASLAENKDAKHQLSESLKNIDFLNIKITDNESHLDQMKILVETLSKEKEEFQSRCTQQAETIKELDISKKDLQIRLESISSRFDDLSQKCSDLELQNADLSAQYQSVKEEFAQALVEKEESENRLCETNHKLNLEIEEKNFQLSKLEEVIHNLKIEKKEIESQLEDQAEHIKQLNICENKLKEELQAKSEEVDRVTSALNDLSNQFKESEVEIQTLKNEIEELREHSKIIESNLSASLAENKDVKGQLSESLKNIDFLNIKITDSESHLNQMKILVETLSEEKNEFQSRCSQQAETIKELEIRKKDLEIRLESISCGFDDLSQKCSDLELHNAEMSAKNQSLKEEFAQALVEKEESENRLCETNYKLNLELEEKNSQLSKLEEVIHNLKIEKVEIEAQLEDQKISLSTKTVDLEKIIEEKKAECINLEKEILILETEYSALDVKFNELTSQLNSVTAGAAHLENVIQEDNFKIELQERTIKKLESASHEKEETIKILKQEIINLEKTIEESKKLSCEKETDVENLQVQLNIKSGEINSLKEEVDKLIKEKEGLNDLFKQVEVEKIENQKAFNELTSENLKLKNDLKVNVDKIANVEQELLAGKAVIAQNKTELDTQTEQLRKANETCERLLEENQTLKKQLASHDPQLREAYDKLFDDNHRLTEEYDELKAQFEKVRASVRAEYDDILAKMKAHMKLTCTRALEAKEEKHAKELKDLKDVVKANQDHISQLSTNLWDTSDKLLITRNENEELKKTVMELKRMLSLNQSAPEGLQRTRSHDQLGLQHQNALRVVEEEAVTVSRRQSIRTVPSGIGKVFPSEDEAEDMFNNDCLADLKAGRCQVSADPDRMSTLMYRNSLCPPHLKSSYPAETQFLPIDTLQEDDIKGRGLGDDTKLGLLPDKRRKDRTQNMELKNVATPRSALREVNDENRKPGTPSRLFSNIFAARPRRNENVQATPDRRRLSFFSKHFKKEPMD